MLWVRIPSNEPRFIGRPMGRSEEDNAPCNMVPSFNGRMSDCLSLDESSILSGTATLKGQHMSDSSRGTESFPISKSRVKSPSDVPL